MKILRLPPLALVLLTCCLDNAPRAVDTVRVDAGFRTSAPLVHPSDLLVPTAASFRLAKYWTGRNPLVPSAGANYARDAALSVQSVDGGREAIMAELSGFSVVLVDRLFREMLAAGYNRQESENIFAGISDVAVAAGEGESTAVTLAQIFVRPKQKIVSSNDLLRLTEVLLKAGLDEATWIQDGGKSLDRRSVSLTAQVRAQKVTVAQLAEAFLSVTSDRLSHGKIGSLTLEASDRNSSALVVSVFPLDRQMHQPAEGEVAIDVNGRRALLSGGTSRQQPSLLTWVDHGQTIVLLMDGRSLVPWRERPQHLVKAGTVFVSWSDRLHGGAVNDTELSEQRLILNRAR